MFNRDFCFLTKLRDISTCLVSKHVHCALSLSRFQPAPWISGKFDWLTFTAWHKITSLFAGIKATKRRQATREVNVSGVLFSYCPVRKKNYKKNAWSRVERNLSVFFFKFSVWLSRPSSPFTISKVENISAGFLNWHAEENLGVNNKENQSLMSRNYRPDSCPFEIWCT